MTVSERQGTAVVTGASSGIGAEYAARLAEEGWDLVLAARRADRLESLADRLRGRHGGITVETLAVDLSEPQDLARTVERVAGDDVSLLVNSAGINGYGRFAEVDPLLQVKVLAVNVTALTTLTRAAVPGMAERGSGAIVNVASTLAFAGSLPPGPLPQRAVYAGTKGYVAVFTRTLAAELGGTPTVQLLCPGLTATEFHMTGGAEPVPGPEPLVHDDGGMPVADVVAASLAALKSGEVVCVPGLAEPEAVERLVAAELDLRDRTGDRIAPRYRGGSTGA